MIHNIFLGVFIFIDVPFQIVSIIVAEPVLPIAPFALVYGIWRQWYILAQKACSAKLKVLLQCINALRNQFIYAVLPSFFEATPLMMFSQKIAPSPPAPFVNFCWIGGYKIRKISLVI